MVPSTRSCKWYVFIHSNHIISNGFVCLLYEMTTGSGILESTTY